MLPQNALVRTLDHDTSAPATSAGAAIGASAPRRALRTGGGGASKDDVRNDERNDGKAAARPRTKPSGPPLRRSGFQLRIDEFAGLDRLDRAELDEDDDAA